MTDDKRKHLSAEPYGAIRVRDLTVLRVSADTTAVIGCDSSGGIGPKERDVVRVPAYIVGRFISRVALMEVIASGARPRVLVSTLCAEPEPTGLEIARGIEDELLDAGLSGQVTITGSSEKNMPTVQTGLGVTVIGFAHKRELRLGQSKAGDLVLCVGIPKVGNEVSLGDREIADTRVLSALMGTKGIHEVVPVGSRGIAYEARELASENGLGFEVDVDCDLDLDRTAGPSTCLVASILPNVDIEDLAASLNVPVNRIGWLG